MTDKPTLVKPIEEVVPIAKPSAFDLDKFKSKRAAAVANVETLQTGLPHHSISQAKDFVRLHPNEERFWSPELCFVSVPIKGQKKDTLHLIEEDLAMQYLPSGRIQRFRLALASKPFDVFFLCHVPTQNTDNEWNASNIAACAIGKTMWVQVTSRRQENVDGYKVDYAREQDAFPDPKWTTQSLGELIGLTFAGRMIDNAEHPALLRLIGAKRAQLCGRAGLPAANVEHVLHWSNYSAKAIAQIQARGMPIDTALWNLVQENKATVIGELLRQFDPSYGSENPIYAADGEWSYARFENWLVSAGAMAWPRLDSGQLDIDGDAFRLMYHMPGIEGLQALRDSLGVIVRAKLPIGRDGRNRPSLFPFGTATGRNAHGKSLYNAHAGMRSFMVFPPDTIGVYLDWRTQEVGIAAALSGDEELIRDYRAGDVYYGLAKLCGQTFGLDLKTWKKDKPGIRQRMKPLQLGINYGMGVPSLAKGLDRHPLIASAIIERHKRTYPRFWEWRAAMVQNAMLERRIDSVFGWPLRITTSPNQRTLYNFPMQAGGAEMLRLAACRLCDANIIPCMLIHDGILLEVSNRKQIAQAIDIMKVAGRDVCDGLEIGVDTDQQLENGARYQDKRPMAKQMWSTMMRVLADVHAIPKEQAYG